LYDCDSIAFTRLQGYITQTTSRSHHTALFL
jgi:hypothetical protein